MSDTQKHNKPNVPNLRFPEFSGEWEKHILGEIGEPYIGLTYSPSDVVSSGGAIVLRSSNIRNGEIDYTDIVRVERKIKENIITREDDLLICARNGSPRLIGKNALLKKEDSNQTFGAFMLIFRSKENHFVHQLLNTKVYYSQVSENLGARINQITTSNIKDFEFYFPKHKNERDKIACFLDLIDERIAIQSKVIKDLIRIKESITRKLLRQKDESSRIVTLGEITEIVSRRNKDRKNYPMYSVTNDRGFIPQTEQFEDREMVGDDIGNYKIIHKDEIAYNPARINVGSIAQYTEEKPCMISSLYVCIRAKKGINSKWLIRVLKSEQLINYYNLYAEGGVRLYLFYPNFSRINTSVS